MLQTNLHFCSGGLCLVLDEPLCTDFANAKQVSPGPVCVRNHSLVHIYGCQHNKQSTIKSSPGLKCCFFPSKIRQIKWYPITVQRWPIILCLGFSHPCPMRGKKEECCWCCWWCTLAHDHTSESVLFLLVCISYINYHFPQEGSCLRVNSWQSRGCSSQIPLDEGKQEATDSQL